MPPPCKTCHPLQGDGEKFWLASLAICHPPDQNAENASENNVALNKKNNISVLIDCVYKSYIFIIIKNPLEKNIIVNFIPAGVWMVRSAAKSTETAPVLKATLHAVPPNSRHFNTSPRNQVSISDAIVLYYD